jgi:glutamine synthetase
MPQIPSGRTVIPPSAFAPSIRSATSDSPYINIASGFLDMHLQPDLSTFRIIRDRPGYATVTAIGTDDHHRPHPIDPRHVPARQQHARASRSLGQRLPQSRGGYHPPHG